VCGGAAVEKYRVGGGARLRYVLPRRSKHTSAQHHRRVAQAKARVGVVRWLLQVCVGVMLGAGAAPCWGASCACGSSRVCVVASYVVCGCAFAFKPRTCPSASVATNVTAPAVYECRAHHVTLCMQRSVHSSNQTSRRHARAWRVQARFLPSARRRHSSR